jgi:hypothetical protein
LASLPGPKEATILIDKEKAIIADGFSSFAPFNIVGRVGVLK